MQGSKISFYASLCENGVHGGAAYLDEEGFCFKCRKSTVEKEYKDLKIPYGEIKSVCSGKRIIIPTTVIETASGRKYRFLIFNVKKFKENIEKKIVNRSAK